jgi:GT2 family glycosyltransferase
MMTDVTVVIATIPPRGKLLRRALASVAAQFELPAAIIVEYDHERAGAAAVRNRALAKVTTEWVAWLDDDDQLLPNHLAALMTAARAQPAADLLYPIPKLVGGRDPTAVSVNGRWQLPWGVPFGPEQREHLLTRGSFIPITHVVRTELVRKAGGFPPTRVLGSGRVQGEDEQYLIALLENWATFVHVEQITWLWNVHADNTGGLPERWP